MVLELDLLPHGYIQDKKHLCLVHDLLFALGFKQHQEKGIWGSVCYHLTGKIGLKKTFKNGNGKIMIKYIKQCLRFAESQQNLKRKNQPIRTIPKLLDF